MDAATPRRSTRLSNKAPSVAAESVVTRVTAGGNRKRQTGPVATLSKIQTRKSNAYGSSGRARGPELLSSTVTTGFTEAFQNQRGDASDEDEHDDGDELDGSSPVAHIIKHGREAPSSPARDPSFSLAVSDDESSADDLAASFANTSKSFGLSHEAGMLVSRSPYDVRLPAQDKTSTPFAKPAVPLRNTPSRVLHGAAQARIPYQARVPTTTKAPIQAQAPVKTPSQARVNAPIYGSTNASVQRPGHVEATPEQPAARPSLTPSERDALDQSIDELIAEEQASLQHEGSHHKAAGGLGEWLGNLQLPQMGEPVWPSKKLLTWALWAFAGFMVLGWFLSAMLSTEYPESAPRTPGVLKALNQRITYMHDVIADFIMPPHFGPTEAKRQVELEMERIKAYKANGEDHFLWGRMTGMDEKYNKRMDEMSTTLQQLQEELPWMMVVRRGKDGSTEISDDFWHALSSKARSAVKDDPEWTRFLEESQAKLRAVFDTTAAQQRVQTDAWAQAITRDEFIGHIERQYENITTQVDKKIDEALRLQSDKLQKTMREESRRAVMDHIRLNALAEANLVANYQFHLSQPNYFSPGLGAIVDAERSSVTFNNHPGRLGELLRRFSWTAGRNPPMAALTKWEEPGDCWCTAHGSPDLGGQAQLAVRMPRPVRPKQVTVEHIPMNMIPARNISNAPRDMELWVETDGPINPYYSHSHVACSQPGPEGWKCLGAFKYNIHAANHRQTFDLAGEPLEPVTRAILRVTSNWGASHTCLYQVRLHGVDAVEDHEYPVGLMD
ncbi:hypothetical protein BDW02DRAFT_539620 [Decorospora gaudefroyi]|uniref:SUN domain-containing protein n=1 Tax=Decorospora gaudefroyi TaxID=184978 RepID=A0A6A5KWR9_9PLEO|nr:hypothetical protein BDW02DRAFT_539620 [Decorospora gaudefroyi]